MNLPDRPPDLTGIWGDAEAAALASLEAALFDLAVGKTSLKPRNTAESDDAAIEAGFDNLPI